MKWMEFIKPDRGVLILFSSLILISVVASTVIRGNPGYLCIDYSSEGKVCMSGGGFGLPFAWKDVRVDYGYCNRWEDGTMVCAVPACR